MMKKLLIMLLTTSLVALSACSASNRNETTPEAAIARDPKPDTIQSHQTESETAMDEPEFKNPGAKDIPTSDQYGNPAESDDPAASQAPNAEATGKNNPGLTDSPETNGVPAETEDLSRQSPEESAAPAQPSAPVPTPPIQEETISSEPPTESTMEQEPTVESTAEPEFDVDYWVDFAISYGRQIGLVYDSGVTECWDNPIIASPNSIYLERDITSRLNRYLKRGMTAFGVWAQPRGGGAYDIYIAYA